MEINQMIAKIDFTDLNVFSGLENIRKLCDSAIKYKTASVCIPSCYVKQAKDYANERMPICTVIGFPNGYSTTPV